MYQENISKGNRVVIISANNNNGPFSVRLYVDYGNVATLVTSKTKTLNGAHQSAQRMIES